MSLIHDALKKAQAEAKIESSGVPPSFQDPVEDIKKPVPTRIIVLAVVLVLAMGYLIYSKFISKPKGPATSAQSADQAQANGAQPAQMGMDDPAKLKKRGADAFSNQDYDTAFGAYTTVVGLTPNDAEAWNNLGVVARKRGDNVKARESYTKAIELKSDYIEAMGNMAELEKQSGNLTKAKELMDKALEIAPSSPEINFNMAVMYEEQNDKKKAVEYYRRFISAAQGFPSSTVDAVRDHVMEIEP